MNRIRRLLRKILERTYLAHLAYFKAPRLAAELYAAWEEYQRDEMYRIRVTVLGFRYAAESFAYDPAMKMIFLNRRFKKDPWLKWRILFCPRSIPRPDILDTAARCKIYG